MTPQNPGGQHQDRRTVSRRQADIVLRENELRFRTVADAVYDWILWLGPEGEVLYCSPSVERITGYRPADFYENPGLLVSILHPEDRDVASVHFKEILPGASHEIEYRILTREGELRWIQHACQPVFDDAGVWRGRNSSNRDITHRKIADEALELARVSIDFASDYTVWLDSEGRFVDVNAPACARLGYARDEILTMSIFDISLAQSPETWPAHWRELRERGPLTFDEEFQTRQGQIFPVETISALFEHNDREYALGIVRDISERKRNEDALRLTQFSVDHVADGVLWLDSRGAIVAANESLARRLGYSRDELAALTIFDIDPAHTEESWRAWWRSLKSRRSLSFETTDRTKSGQMLVQEIRATYVEFEGREYSCSFSLDITDRKQAEAYRETGREILQILNEPGDFKDALDRVVSALKRGTGSDAVGIRLQEGDDFPYFIHSGFSADFLLTENTLVERAAGGGLCRDEDGNVSLECTCGLVISGKTDPSSPFFTQGGSFWTSDSFPMLDIPPDDDPRLHPRNVCIHQGYASVALVPIRDENGIVGLVQLNDRRKGRFTPEALELLEGIAAHIGAALMRKQAEEALRESQELLSKYMRHSPIYTYIKDVVPTESRVVEASENFRDMIGIPAEDMIGKTMAELFPPEFAAKMTADDWSVVSGGTTLQLDEELNG